MDDYRKTKEFGNKKEYKSGNANICGYSGIIKVVVFESYT